MRFSCVRVACATLGIALFSCAIAQAQLTWSTESSTGFTSRGSHAAAAVDGKIYVMGGGIGTSWAGVNTFEMFDPSTGQWSTPATTGILAARTGPAAVAHDGKLYVIGGLNIENPPVAVQMYDPATIAWSEPVTTGTFSPRYSLTCVVLDGKVYAFGGGGPGVVYNTLEVFDLATNAWTTPVTTGTFTKRQALAVAVVDGKIYAIGGYGEGASVNTLEVFDPATNHWSTPVTTGTFVARSGVNAIVVNKKILVIGNRSPDGSFLDEFDPQTNTWSTPATSGATTARSYIASVLVGNKIYVMGGVSGTGSNLAYLNTNESLTLPPSAVDSEYTPAATIELFPNPTRGIVSVRNAKVLISRVVVANSLGERVLEIRDPNDNDLTLDLSDLASGSYYVTIMRAGTATTQMIVRE